MHVYVDQLYFCTGSHKEVDFVSVSYNPLPNDWLHG